jgi:transaldolase/glucose-6-phosphate isomerase
VRVSLEENVAEEIALLARLEEVGIKLDEVTQQVLDEGVSLFTQSFEKLMKTIKSRRDEIVSGLKASQSTTAPD